MSKMRGENEEDVEEGEEDDLEMHSKLKKISTNPM